MEATSSRERWAGKGDMRVFWLRRARSVPLKSTHALHTRSGLIAARLLERLGSASPHELEAVLAASRWAAEDAE